MRPFALRLSYLLVVVCLITLGRGASADEWRKRSIYQLVTDRFALEDGATTNCDPSARTWCGGTWKAIEQNLDYIQNAGFTAICISPTSQNWLGPRTPYGDAYTGYWVQDISQLNDHFGSAATLKSLSDAVHSRGMFLMIDVVVNNVMAVSTTPDYSQYFFKESAMYHPYCPVVFGNRTSEMDCWLGDLNVTLPDLNTTNAQVVKLYQNWIQQFVQQFHVDGLRIDAAKHVNPDFWTTFCGAAGVFCIGEVFGSDITLASSYQSNALDSVLNYPIYDALVQAFTIPGPGNMSGLVQAQRASGRAYRDTTILGNFIENQDNPRWANLSVDPQSMYNAMVYTFMSDGIPIVYYGQEQSFHGSSDPFNREPLWPSHYANTTAYQMIYTLNTFRNFLIFGDSGSSSTPWSISKMQIIASSQHEIALIKGDVISVMTNVGSPPAPENITIYTPWAVDTDVTEIFTCQNHIIGSNRTLFLDYSKGGRADIFILSSSLEGSGMCGTTSTVIPGGSSATLHGRAISICRTIWMVFAILLGQFVSLLCLF